MKGKIPSKIFVLANSTTFLWYKQLFFFSDYINCSSTTHTSALLSFFFLTNLNARSQTQSKFKHNFECFNAKVFLFTECILGTVTCFGLLFLRHHQVDHLVLE